jgi:hypothetical protein
MKMREGVEAVLREAFDNAPQSRNLEDLKTTLMAEIDAKEATVSKVFTFETFLKRCRVLGMLAEPQREYGDIMDNQCNRTKFYEYERYF